MNPGYVYNKTDILHYIEFIDRKFSLIMITEYFYESVVLLRRIMKWSMQGNPLTKLYIFNLLTAQDESLPYIDL